MFYCPILLIFLLLTGCSSQPADEAALVALTDWPLVEGFSEIVRSNHRSDDYPGHRGAGPSYWAYYRTEREEVVWKTAAHGSEAGRVYAFTASTGEYPGKAVLSIKGQTRLRFETGVDEGNLKWAEGDFQLEFRPVLREGGLSGYYLLRVPPGAIAANAKAELSVTFEEGGSVTWFMIKGYTDTIEHEGLSGS